MTFKHGTASFQMPTTLCGRAATTSYFVEVFVPSSGGVVACSGEPCFERGADFAHERFVLDSGHCSFTRQIEGNRAPAIFSRQLPEIPQRIVFRSLARAVNDPERPATHP
jgi:hypothetical protein